MGRASTGMYSTQCKSGKSASLERTNAEEVFPSGPANYKKVPMSQVDSGWLRGAMASFCTALMSFMAYVGCNGSNAQLYGLKFLITGVKSWPLVMRQQ